MRSCPIAQHHPPGLWEPWLGAHAGMGVTGCTPSWTRDGGCRGVGTARGKPSQGGTNLLLRGWIWDCEVGDSPDAPLERCLSGMRVWGSAEVGEKRGEKKKEDVSEVSWSAGAERGLAAALQGCREGSGGDVGALGEGLRAVCWWVWGCFHPACSREALASFARCR